MRHDSWKVRGPGRAPPASSRTVCHLVEFPSRVKTVVQILQEEGGRLGRPRSDRHVSWNSLFQETCTLCMWLVISLGILCKALIVFFPGCHIDILSLLPIIAIWSNTRHKWSTIRTDYPAIWVMTRLSNRPITTAFEVSCIGMRYTESWAVSRIGSTANEVHRIASSIAYPGAQCLRFGVSH